MIRVLALLLAAIASGTCAAQATPALPIEALDKWLEALHDQHHFSGAVVIQRAGKVLYARGIGLANAATSSSFTPDTRTDGAGLAKPFTATAVLLLEEAGSIDIGSPVRRYVREYPDEATKVADLLSHRGNLPDYPAFDALVAQKKPITTLAMLQEVPGMPPPHPVGGIRFHTCNLCFDTAALVVERTAGRNYQAFLRERVFQALGMERALVRPARLEALPADRAIGYRFPDGKREIFDALDFEGYYGGGNVYATAREFARFAQAFAMPSPKGPPIVPKKALWPLVPHGDLISVLTLGSWYCAKGVDRCYYAGTHRGFHNAMYFDRTQQLVVVYVSNSGVPAWLRPRILRELVATAEGRLPALPVQPRLANLSPEILKGAEGTYDVPGAGRVTLLEIEGKPYVRAGGANVEYQLQQVSPTELYTAGLDATIGIGTDGRLSWATGFIDSYGTRR